MNVTARSLRAALGALLAIIAGSAPFAYAPSAHAQPWRWESPRPQGNTLRDACVDSAGALWLAGEVGTLGTFEPTAGSWDPVAVRSTEDLVRVACCPGAVIAVGAHGSVVRRDAAGAHEQVLGGASAAMLTGVACVGERGVVASGAARELWVSSDSGATFERRAAPHELFAVHSIDDAIVASGPRGALARSTDLGRTWSAAPSGVSTNLLAFAGDRSDLVAVGAGGAAVRSTDGGESWAVVATNVSADLLAVARGPRGEVMAVGAADVALAGRRGGPLASIGALPGRFHGLVPIAGGWVAVGVGGRLAVRRGSGRFTIASRWEPSLYDSWSDGRTRLVVGGRGFIARAEGDRELRVVRAPTVVSIHAVTMNASGIALAVGADGLILRSTDHGRRWRQIALPADRLFNSVWLDDQGHALAVGERGQRYRSDDGGLTWASVSLGREVGFTGIASRGSTLWVVGLGRLERSDDFGRTWQTEAPPSRSSDLRTPFVTPRGALVVTARPGTVSRRDAQGAWTSVDLHPSAVFTGLSGDERELLLVASDGAMFASPDDGVTWVEQRAMTREVLTSVRFAPGGRTYVTGYGGTLLARP